MMTTHKTDDGLLQPTPHFTPGSWTNLVNPTHEELARVVENVRIPADVLSDALDIDERARCEYDEGYLFVILRIPVVDNAETHPRYFTVPLGVIMTADCVLTVCRKENDVTEEFLRRKIKGFTTLNHSRFLLQVMLRTALLFLRDLKAINARTGVVQEKLHRATVNKHLLGLMELERSLVYFTTSLRSNEIMFERLQKLPCIKFNEDDQDLFDDVMVETRQAIEMASIYNSILAGMMDAFASVISNNMNVILKILTSITIILAWPTLIFSLYGMNVALPFQRSSMGFWIVMSFTIFSTILLVGVFIKRRWF